MTFATSIGSELLSNLGFNPAILFYVISVYGELGLSLSLTSATLFPILKLKCTSLMMEPILIPYGQRYRQFYAYWRKY
jgi:hypothetical protein